MSPKPNSNCFIMKCFTSTAFVLVVISETLLAAVLSGNHHLTNGQEIEEPIMMSRFRGPNAHDHRTDSDYNGILSDEDDIEIIKRLKPSEIKARVQIVLEKIDHNKDGYIDKQELADKLLKSYRKLSAEESDSEFETSDVDENGFITWEEYIGDTFSSNHELENEMKEDKALFLAADNDLDGQLNLLEFRCFYTPEDYPHMKPTVLNGIMNRFDTNKDGKITFDEFIDERKIDRSEEWMVDENNKFALELDVNKNGVLDDEEVYDWASPENSVMAESEAENLIFKADKNRDGILSFNEILENYNAFISPGSDGYIIFRDEL